MDTHADIHVAAIVDTLGRTLATQSVPTTSRGYAELLAWAQSFGDIQRFGIEGTGSWGAALARNLTAHGYEVLDVNRPDRAARRRNGKSDPWTPRPPLEPRLPGSTSRSPSAKTAGWR